MNAHERDTDGIPLVVHRIPSDTDWPLRPAPLRRAWMDAFKDRWPYRCLPLDIANQAGWEILCPVSVEVVWDGGEALDAVRVVFDERPELHAPLIRSHFGGGLVTFCPPLLFRTEAPVGLWVRGPSNDWIDGAAALDGWVESWGLEASFTMNWKITRPHAPVRFEKGHPICLVQPFDPGLLERVHPVAAELHEDPELADRYERWKTRRALFGALRDARTSQHTYVRGTDEDGEPVPGHRTGVALRPFCSEER